MLYFNALFILGREESQENMEYPEAPTGIIDPTPGHAQTPQNPTLGIPGNAHGALEGLGIFPFPGEPGEGSAPSAWDTRCKNPKNQNEITDPAFACPGGRKQKHF